MMAINLVCLKEHLSAIGLEFLLALWMVLLRQMALEKDLLPLIYCFVVNTKERKRMFGKHKCLKALKHHQNKHNVYILFLYYDLNSCRHHHKDESPTYRHYNAIDNH